MTEFQIFRNKKDGRIDVVKQGWSWPGFFFGPFWVMQVISGGMGCLAWIATAIAALIVAGMLGTALGLRDDQVEEYGGVVFNVAVLMIAAIYGYWGNKWRSSRLMKKYDWEILDTVEGADAKSVKMEWSERKKVVKKPTKSGIQFEVLSEKDARSAAKRHNFSNRSDGIECVRIASPVSDGYYKIVGALNCHNCGKGIDLDIDFVGFGGPELTCKNCGCIVQTMGTSKSEDGQLLLLLECSPMTSIQGQSDSPIKLIIKDVVHVA